MSDNVIPFALHIHDDGYDDDDDGGGMARMTGQLIVDPPPDSGDTGISLLFSCYSLIA